MFLPPAGHPSCHWSETKLQSKADSVIKSFTKTLQVKLPESSPITLATYVTQMEEKESNLKHFSELKIPIFYDLAVCF